jgi:hypothetical protein
MKSVKIELPETLWEELAREAKQEAVSPEEHVVVLLSLAMAQRKQVQDAQAPRTEALPKADRDPQLLARVRRVRGRFARTESEPGSEELHRERRVDKEKEERLLQGRAP